MRRDVEFVADGTILRGWLYAPDEGDGPFPAVIMSHGFSAVKEQIQLTAEVLVEAGLCVLLYDHRNLGASDGEPRQDIDPWAQIRDMRDAITYVQSLDEVDADRVGIWGTSYSGGHVLAVAGIDKRVKCVVSQVPLVAGIDNFRRIVAAELFPELQKQLDADRAARMRGEPTGTMPIASLDPAEAVAFPGPRTHYFLVEHEVGQAGTSWRNECTLRSIDRALEYDVTPFFKHISPAPLLLMVSTVVDNTTPADIALAAFNTALEPKKAILLPGDHYSPYFPEEDFPQASSAARDWFVEHLVQKTPKAAPVA